MIEPGSVAGGWIAAGIFLALIIGVAYGVTWNVKHSERPE